MVEFEVAIVSPALMGAIAVHGAHDIMHATTALPVYVMTMLLLACDDDLTTALFFACSVVHFSHDMLGHHLAPAALLVVGLSLVGTHAPYVASLAMTCYLAVVHVPLLLADLLARGDTWEAVALAGMLAGAAARPCVVGIPKGARRMCLSHRRQRIIVAHVLTSELLRVDRTVR